MLESEADQQGSVGREPTGGYRGVALVAVVLAAYVAGWRSRRRWGRFLGW